MMSSLTTNTTPSTEKQNFIWNSIAGLINAAEAVILLMVITRTNGLMDAGIITIAFSIGNLMMTIGKYGVRNYQVTDVEHTYSFRQYYSHRICTVFLMLAVTVLYLGYCFLTKDYSFYKIAVVFLICGIYMVESVEDVFWGLYQQHGQLGLGGRIFSFRWIIHLSLITLLLILTQNTLLALGGGLLGGGCYTWWMNRKHVSQYAQDTRPLTGEGIGTLMQQCFPLFVVAFLSNYVNNAPKYAIDTYMSEEVQACYGFIAMPVFVIGLLNSFIYQPFLVKFTLDWRARRVALFQKRIFRQMLVILGITAICLTGGYLLGIPVLSMIYHTDLTSYKAELLILLAGGGLLAVVGFLCVVMTVMRTQKKMMVGYGLTAVFAKLLSGYFIKAGGVLGAALLYIALMGILSITFSIVVAHDIKKIGDVI